MRACVRTHAAVRGAGRRLRRADGGADRHHLLARLVHVDHVRAVLQLDLVAGRQERVEANDQVRMAAEQVGHTPDHARSVDPEARHGKYNSENDTISLHIFVWIR